MKPLLIAAFALLTSHAQASDPVRVSAESMRSSSGRHLTVVARLVNATDQSFDLVWFRCDLMSGGKVVVASRGLYERLRPRATAFKELIVDKFPNATVTCEFERTQ